MVKIFSHVTALLSSVIGSPQIDPNDGIDTVSEKMIPGAEFHEQAKWLLDRLATSSLLAALTFAATVFQPLTIPLSILLCIYLLFSLVQHVNTLLTAKTWSLLSALIQTGFYIAVLIALF